MPTPWPGSDLLVPGPGGMQCPKIRYVQHPHLESLETIPTKNQSSTIDGSTSCRLELSSLRVDSLAAATCRSILSIVHLSPFTPIHLQTEDWAICAIGVSEMSLFEGRIARSAVYAGGAAVVAHLVMKLVPYSVQTYSLMQTAVAILAIASLAVMVVTHHRRSGDLLTHSQEEIVLITAFGLMWFAILLGWRAFQQRGIAPGNAAGTDLGDPSQGGHDGFTPGRRPYPCRSDSVYCVVEEWTYW